MGFGYLDGKCWARVTREERFFCQHLYGLLVSDKENKILACMRDNKRRELPRVCEWEPAFEVCFYRDLWHFRARNGKPNPPEPYSLKRTFDLCLFSEQAILIIEAKAQQPFRDDQVKSFKKDCCEVRKRTHVRDVRMIGLASSKYEPSKEVLCAFDGPLLTWRCLSRLYGDDKVLLRADEVYEGPMSGDKLIEAHLRGEDFCVGRIGGRDGKVFRKDLSSGNWQTREYRTLLEQEPPNGNWFRLSEFVKAAENRGRTVVE